MTKLVVSSFISKGTLLVYLDNVQIVEDAQVITMELEERIEYIIHWFVKGPPGNSYSITVSSPREAQFQLTRSIGHAGKGLGGFKFRA